MSNSKTLVNCCTLLNSCRWAVNCWFRLTPMHYLAMYVQATMFIGWCFRMKRVVCSSKVVSVKTIIVSVNCFMSSSPSYKRLFVQTLAATQHETGLLCWATQDRWLKVLFLPFRRHWLPWMIQSCQNCSRLCNVDFLQSSQVTRRHQKYLLLYLCLYYTVSQKRDPDVIDCNFEKD